MTEITKQEIIGYIMTKYINDLDFIETVNNLTYAQKVKLKREQRNTKNQIQ